MVDLFSKEKGEKGDGSRNGGFCLRLKHLSSELRTTPSVLSFVLDLFVSSFKRFLF